MSTNRIPPLEKVFEAYGAIADGRITIISRTDDSAEAEVRSSDGSKTYTVLRNSDTYSSNDNSTYWQGYPGYPVIALMMMLGELPLDENLAKQFGDVNWNELNRKHKRDYAAAVAEVMTERHIDAPSALKAAEAVITRLKSLPLTIKRGRLRPPTV